VTLNFRPRLTRPPLLLVLTAQGQPFTLRINFPAPRRGRTAPGPIGPRRTFPAPWLLLSLISLLVCLISLSPRAWEIRDAVKLCHCYLPFWFSSGGHPKEVGGYPW